MAMVLSDFSTYRCQVTARRADGRRAHSIGTIWLVSGIPHANRVAGGCSQTMMSIQDAARFLRAAHKKMRSGEHSREPVKLLRIEWKADAIECDWLMRPSDSWDVDLPPRLAKENQTLQALKDALSLRDMIFKSFPSVVKAELRMFRVDANSEFELMMTGSVARTNEVFERVASVAMRARLCGFRFNLAAGVMEGRPR